ncbi:MAG TPA: penicillin acylase family protein [Bdellovibrionota bacterium]|nr:penicillin acylase family protein [Bdellovibrionota bacterium]
MDNKLVIPRALLVVAIGLGISARVVKSEAARENPLVATLQGKKCDLFDDSQGIPHIRGESENVAISCLGYIHARDRLFEMDFFRRTVQGRKAEVFGKDEIRSDFQMRLLGLYPYASRIFREMAGPEQTRLWAYAHGVNTFLKSASKRAASYPAYEFEKYGYIPESWIPEDTIALILLQSFDQTKRSFFSKLEEDRYKEFYPARAAGYFDSDGLPWDTAILKSGEYLQAPMPVRQSTKSAVNRGSAFPDIRAPRTAKLGKLDELEFLNSGIGLGSNNWVVNSARSRTGRAWLANDPHLKLQYPPLWHWVHVEGGTLNVIGAAMPGLPFVVSGANTKISWGLTNAYLDVGHVAYIDTVDLKPLETTRPLIWFKWWKLKLPFFFKTFQRTDRGQPVLPLSAPEGKAVVLNWVGLSLHAKDMGDTIRGLFELMASESASKADQALAAARVPTWNFVFAASDGKIGYRAVGRIPKVEASPPFGVVASKLVDWQKELSGMPDLSTTEMPHVFNPTRGYIATANNRQWPPEARFTGGRAYRSGFRAFRIEELLKKTPRHDLASMKRIQCDVQAVDARFLIPEMLEALSENLRRREPEAVELLRSWDFEATLECRACALSRRWLDRVLGAAQTNENGLYRALRESKGSKEYDAIKEVIRAEWIAAVLDVKGLSSWGDAHRNRFVHIVGPGAFFGEESLPTPGDDESVNPGSSDWEQDASGRGHFEHSAGASQRLIVELTDPPTVYAVLPGPNRDVPTRNLLEDGSPWKKWRDCQLERRWFPLDWKAVRLNSIEL